MNDEEFLELSKTVEETIASGAKAVKQARKVIESRAEVLREIQATAAALERVSASRRNEVDQRAQDLKLAPEDIELGEQGAFREQHQESRVSNPGISRIIAKRGRV